MNLRGDGKKQNFGVVSMVLYFVYIVSLSLLAFQCVIVGLQSTGEARTLEQLEESGGDLTDFVSIPLQSKTSVTYLSTQKDVRECDRTSYSIYI